MLLKKVTIYCLVFLLIQSHAFANQPLTPPQKNVIQVGDEFVVVHPSGNPEIDQALEEEAQTFLPTLTDPTAQPLSEEEASLKQRLQHEYDNKFDEHSADLPAVIELAARLEDLLRETEAREGRAGVLKRADKDELKLPASDLGRAEIKLIKRNMDEGATEENSVLIPRIVLNKSQYGYLLVDKASKVEDIEHFKIYLARHLVESGPNKDGRNLMILKYEGGDIAEIEHHEKPKKTSAAWWAKQLRAKFKMPTAGDLFMGGVFFGVVVQGALSGLYSYVKTGAITTDATLFTMAYGLTIGTFVSFYRNLVNTGSKWARVLKAHVVSAAYAYGLIFWLGGDKAETLSLMSAQALLLHLNIHANGILNNYINKDPWNQLNALRSITRQNNTKWDLGPLGKWNRASFEYQLTYMIPWSLNFLTLMSISAGGWTTIPVIDVALPVYQVMGMFVAHWILKFYSQRLYAKSIDDPTLKGKTEDLRGLRDNYSNQWKTLTGQKLAAVPTKIWNSCKSMFANIFGRNSNKSDQ